MAIITLLNAAWLAEELPKGLILWLALGGAGDPAGPPPAAQPTRAPAAPSPETPLRSPPLRATIDALLASSWHTSAVEPAAACDDATFLRRLSLDLRGAVPERAEVTAYLSDPNPNRRATLIESVLASESLARRLAAVYADLLTDGKEQQRPQELALMRRALEQGFASGKGFDAITRDLIAARGRSDENPATAFIVAYEAKKDDLAAVTARTFLGLQIQCAQCHDHPFDHWKNTDFKAFAAFFQGTVTRRVEKGEPAFEVIDRSKPLLPKARRRLRDLLANGKAAQNPKVQERMKAMADWTEPRFLDGTPLGASDESARQALAEWITAPGNPWFAKATVNRFWALLLGRGVVDPVDDLNAKNAPVVAGLLEAMANDFVARGYDVKYLLREIVSSRAYQLAATGAKGEPEAVRSHFASFAVRPLAAEQVLRSIGGAADLRGGRVTAQTGGDALSAAAEPADAMRGLRRVVGQFRYAFQDDEGEEGEAFSGTLSRALLLMNSGFLQEAVSARRGGLVSQVLGESKVPSERLHQLFLATLSRPPRGDERQALGRSLEAQGRPAAYEDVLWALFNSSEFLTNH